MGAKRSSVDGERLSLVGVLLLGFAVRVVGLGGPTLWLDELIQIYLAKGQVSSFAEALPLGANMPADYFITKAALTLGGQEFWLRAAAVLLGVLSIALLYALTRRFLRAPGPLLAAALLALSPLAVQHSREVRPYSLFLCLTLLSTLLLVLAISRPWLWIGYAVTALALLHTHLFALPLLPMQGLMWLLLTPRGSHRRRWLPGIAAFVGVIAVFLASPFRPTYLIRFGQALIAGITGIPAAQTLQIAPASQTFPPVRELLPLVPFYLSGAYLWGALILVAVLLGVIALRGHRRLLLILLTWLIIPPALILYTLAQRNQFFSPRYLILSLPPALMLAAAGLAALGATPAPHPLRRALPFAAAIVAVALTLPQLAEARHPFSEDWRAAAHYVQQHAPGGAVLIAPGVAGYLRHYLPDASVFDIADADEIEDMALPGLTVFVLQSPYSALPTEAAPWLAPDQRLAHFIPTLDLYRVPELQPDITQLPPPWATRSLADLKAQDTLPRRATLNSLYRLEQEQRASRDWDAAAATLAVMLAIKPDRVEAWAEMGFVQQQLGRRPLAIAAYRRVAELAPEHRWANILLANQLRSAGQPLDALAPARRATEIAPDMPEAWAALGWAQLEAGQAKSARASFARGAELDPDNPDIVSGQALAATRMGGGGVGKQGNK